MRKLFTLGVLLLLGVTALGPSQGQAFNSGTHIYIVERVFPFTLDKTNLYYGSIAPDLSLYVDDPEDWPTGFSDTHYEFIKLPYAWWNLTQKAFAKGWQTHNEIWGADYFAHVVFFDGDQDGYVTARAKKLAYLFPALEYPPDYELAHFAIEVAIDVLLVRYHDPSLGLKLLWAAKYRSQEDFNLMLDTLPTDGGTLGAAEEAFRDLVINYATALALPDPLRMFAISELGSQIAKTYYGVDIDPVDVRWILRVAMYLCQDSDYMEVIESAIWRIRTNPDLIR